MSDSVQRSLRSSLLHEGPRWWTTRELAGRLGLTCTGDVSARLCGMRRRGEVEGEIVFVQGVGRRRRWKVVFR